jgi:bla regulator protein blaR1
MKKIVLMLSALMIALSASMAQVKIKGDAPLIIINGNESSVAEIEKLDPAKIESIEVVKGKEAKKIYGKKGKDGAIVVQLKWNRKDKDLASSFDGNLIFIVADKQISKFELDEIDPNSIESIEVLKGATATAMYGERGENGVVIIKLKSSRFKSFLPFEND